MRIRKVTAHAFGPFAGETLEFAEGMTVLVGDNESGKSTWHAAIYAAICGRRRGKGQPKVGDRLFAEKHKPWTGDHWVVSAQIDLDDGRCIELRHDLAGGVDCSAKDLTVGSDVSNEIMFDGAPDGAVWLGLDRSSFVATACVQQAEMLRVCRDADGLQECLQQAAASASTDTTAAAAIELIENFQREWVGLDRANSTKPLRQALDRLSDARAALEQARKAHDEYLSRLERVDALREKARASAARAQAAEAAASVQLAARLNARAERVRELTARYGDNPPTTATSDDALAQQVRNALTTYEQRPAAPTDPQPSSRAIQAEIDLLPPVPDGDVEVHQSVQRAVEALNAAASQLAMHDQGRPAEPATPPQVAAGDQELLDLASSLEAPLPTVPDDIVNQERITRAAIEAPPARTASTVLLSIGAVAVALGLVLSAAATPAVGLVVLAAGVILVGVGASMRRRVNPLAAARDHAEAEGRLRAAHEQVDLATRRRQQTVERCHQLGLAPDPEALRAIPLARAHATAGLGEQDRWLRNRAALQAAINQATVTLRQALIARGAESATDGADKVLALAERYRQECHARASHATQAGRRAALLEQLAGAQQAEQRAAADRKSRTAADHVVQSAAATCSLVACSPEDAAESLQRWLTDRTNRLGELSAAQKEWAELQALLEGQSPAEIQRAAQAAIRDSEERERCADPTLIAQIDRRTAADELPQLRRAAADAKTLAAGSEGELRQYAAGLLDVAEAEETAAVAEVELGRVRELDDTLSKTRQFLVKAQTRVHQDIAPVLSASLKQWLSEVTGGRYSDAIVNPTTLQVQVCGPSRRWHPADRLSYGTAEQIYLLLRVALAEHLTRGHDTCPLLLDDVTVHADDTRTEEVLNLLLRIAEQRQVVVFSQEATVARWADKSLTGGRHLLRRLPPIPVT